MCDDSARINGAYQFFDEHTKEKMKRLRVWGKIEAILHSQ